uniref:Uncharacterized protein n=1 Tax=viral metagenome TaxID=1070528 RepID=A0A6H1ZD80_9ZZZZ
MIINYDWANSIPEPYWVTTGILNFDWVSAKPNINIVTMPATIVLQIRPDKVLEVSGTDNIGNLQPIKDNRISIVVSGIAYSINPFSSDTARSYLVRHIDGVLTIKVLE